MEKTLGGDRLGSGKKLKVHLHNYERSTHDLGFLFRSTMSAGTLVPFMCEVALPGDTFDINLDCDIKTHPTIGPLFGSYKVQLDIFVAPVRLYNAQLHNNTLGIGRNMSAVKLPQIEMTAIDSPITEDIDNTQINPSSLLAYVGLRGVGFKVAAGTPTRQFNAIPILAYWEIYKNYYANKQEEIGAVLHTPAAGLVSTVNDIDWINSSGTTQIPFQPLSAVIPSENDAVIQLSFTGTEPIPNQIMIQTSVGLLTLEELSGGSMGLTTPGVLTGSFAYGTYGEITIFSWRYRAASDLNPGKPEIETFALSLIDDMREAILSEGFTNSAFVINDADLVPYKYLYQQPNGIPNVLSSQEGLALKTYQSDLFNNWLKTENIAAISTATAIDTSGGSFTIDQLILSKKIYNMLNRINVSGGSYDDWLDAVYMNERHRQAESPMYMGGLIKELVFQEVVSNSLSEDQPLGTLAGKGVLAKKHKGGTVVVKVDEPSYIMGIVSLTPRLDYSQGNKWDVNLKTMDDFHKPALDEIGFQELITEQMAWWDTQWTGAAWVQRSAGKQPAWVNYMTNVNVTRGNFAIRDNEMFMTLNRRYENTNAARIEDLTTYIDPSKFNFIFAQTALDAQNFWTQIAVDITARRKMSAKVMPNL